MCCREYNCNRRRLPGDLDWRSTCPYRRWQQWQYYIFVLPFALLDSRRSTCSYRRWQQWQILNWCTTICIARLLLNSVCIVQDYYTIFCCSVHSVLLICRITYQIILYVQQCGSIIILLYSTICYDFHCSILC